MPAPKRSNTAAAHAARRLTGEQTMADRLRAAGYLVVPPELASNWHEWEYPVTTYTAEIEVGNDTGTIWQAVAPAENFSDWLPNTTARDAAQWVASNQTIIAGTGPARVRVWRGADADTSRPPDAEVYLSDDA